MINTFKPRHSSHVKEVCLHRKDSCVAYADQKSYCFIDIYRVDIRR